MKAPSLKLMAVSAGSVAAMVGVSATTAYASVPASSANNTKTVTTNAANSVGNLTSTVTGTFTNSDGTGTFKGTFTPSKFSVVNGVLEATGVLKGTLTDANGNSLGTVSQTVTDAVNTTASANAAAAGCQILNLVLGPLNLNLLGLVVTLNQVNLNITAVPGAGNLLGNLLCAVANLLNGGGGLGSLSTLLNEILAALGL
jgi:hypothetical protein